LETAGSGAITVELAVAWASLPQGVQPLHWAKRLSAVRGFARYMQTIDPATEVPPRDVLAVRQQRPAPYLWSELDIRRLVEAARHLEPSLRAASCEALFGLLAASGMRISEALSLKRDDVDLAGGIATVHGGKFGRERLVPLHESTIDALGSYARRRDHLCPSPRPDAFFVSSTGRALCISTVRSSFNRVTRELGLRTRSVRPRIHDLRHTFAVRTLVNWLQDGADIDAQMPVLAAYLGHIDPASTYWYLEASPELMQRAAAHLDGHLGERS
jgi:integrase/recombinase XerD